MTNIITLFSCA